MQEGGGMPTCPAWMLFMSSLMSCHFLGGLSRITKATGAVVVVAVVDTGSEKVSAGRAWVGGHILPAWVLSRWNKCHRTRDSYSPSSVVGPLFFPRGW